MPTAKKKNVMYFSIYSIIWVLRENGVKWDKFNVCMGGKDICHSGDLVGKDRASHITSFGEDENGKTKIIAAH